MLSSRPSYVWSGCARSLVQSEQNFFSRAFAGVDLDNLYSGNLTLQSTLATLYFEWAFHCFTLECLPHQTQRIPCDLWQRQLQLSFHFVIHFVTTVIAATFLTRALFRHPWQVFTSNRTRNLHFVLTCFPTAVLTYKVHSVLHYTLHFTLARHSLQCTLSLDEGRSDWKLQILAPDLAELAVCLYCEWIELPLVCLCLSLQVPREELRERERERVGGEEKGK